MTSKTEHRNGIQIVHSVAMASWSWQVSMASGDGCHMPQDSHEEEQLVESVAV